MILVRMRLKLRSYQSQSPATSPLKQSNDIAVVRNHVKLRYFHIMFVADKHKQGTDLRMKDVILLTMLIVQSNLLLWLHDYHHLYRATAL